MIPFTLLIRKNLAMSPHGQCSSVNPRETAAMSGSPRTNCTPIATSSHHTSCWFGRYAEASLAFLSFAIFTLSPSRAEAQCAQWDASGDWILHQDNGFSLYMHLQQNGMGVTGTALSTTGKYNVWPIPQDKGTKGSVYGNVQDTDFTVQIHWENGDIAVYRGNIGHDSKTGQAGKLGGYTYRAKDPSHKVHWDRNGAMQCAQTAPAPAPAPAAPPRPIKHVGKPTKPAAPAGEVIPPPSAGVPGITASPKTVTIPAGQSEGTTTLTWDGGADHAYAEVWVQVDNGDEEFVVEKGKGTRSVRVERGKTYLYILTDSGQRLATVTVKTK